MTATSPAAIRKNAPRGSAARFFTPLTSTEPAGRTVGSHQLIWRGDTLRYAGQLLATVIPDDKYRGMWRVQLPGGQITDMVNRSRAKDAAIALALGRLNDRSVA